MHSALALGLLSGAVLPQRVNFREFLGRVDGRGGFAVVETEDATLIAKDVAPFYPWYSFTVHPVLEIADTAAINGEALAFVGSIS